MSRFYESPWSGMNDYSFDPEEMSKRMNRFEILPLQLFDGPERHPTRLEDVSNRLVAPSLPADSSLHDLARIYNYGTQTWGEMNPYDNPLPYMDQANLLRPQRAIPPSQSFFELNTRAPGELNLDYYMNPLPDRTWLSAGPPIRVDGTPPLYGDVMMQMTRV